jgi:hypothetical protein
MADRQGYDLRAEMFETLMEKVETDRFPSTTMLDWIEEILTPEELPIYAEALLRRIREDTYPSVPMINRLMKLT